MLVLVEMCIPEEGRRLAIEDSFQNLSEPVAAVGDPPAGEDNWDCRGQCPPKGKHDIGEQAERGEGDPEDFAFHTTIVFSPAIGQGH